MSNNNNNVVEEINDILGYGKKIKVLDGIDGDGKEKIIEIHLTPVSISKTSELFKKIEEISSIEDYTDEKFLNSGAEIIKLATEKMHPDFDLDRIKKLFGLAGVMKAIRVVADINDFLSETRKVAEMTKEINTLK